MRQNRVQLSVVVPIIIGWRNLSVTCLSSSDEWSASPTASASEGISEAVFRNLTLEGAAEEACEQGWQRKDVVDLIVTEFRKNPTYIKVGMLHLLATLSWPM